MLVAVKSLANPDLATLANVVPGPVVVDYTQLRSARRLVADLRLRWDRPNDPALLTPCRVPRLRATIGTPASATKSTKARLGGLTGTRKPGEPVVQLSRVRLGSGPVV
jgi:hypothetical protein